MKFLPGDFVISDVTLTLTERPGPIGNSDDGHSKPNEELVTIESDEMALVLAVHSASHEELCDEVFILTTSCNLGWQVADSFRFVR